MSKKDSAMQVRFMSWFYRGTEIFKPLNTGRIDDRVKCLREYVANIFFYTKNGTTVMIDGGYNYERLAEKMAWLDIKPSEIRHILVTHQDTDHVGAMEEDSAGLLRQATMYIGEIENRYLTGEVPRRVMFRHMKLSQVHIPNEKVLVSDGQILDIDGIRIECILVPGHTWGQIVYLIDDAYLFTGDAIWFGPDGGYSFIAALAEDNDLSVRSLQKLRALIRDRGISPKVITGHTGWSDNMDWVFAHIDKLCKRSRHPTLHDPKAPYDGYDESDDTEERARTVLLARQDG